MATILSQGITCDGYDVRILDGGESHTIHFQTMPADVAAEVASFVARLADQRAAEEIAANMEAIESDA